MSKPAPFVADAEGVDAPLRRLRSICLGTPGTSRGVRRGFRGEHAERASTPSASATTVQASTWRTRTSSSGLSAAARDGRVPGDRDRAGDGAAGDPPPRWASLAEGAPGKGRRSTSRLGGLTVAHERAILLVEDNPDDEALTRRAFARNNIQNEIVVAHDGVEALDYLFGTGTFADRDPSRTPQVVLLDLKLPRIDGLEVLRRIRADDRLKLLRWSSSLLERGAGPCRRLHPGREQLRAEAGRLRAVHRSGAATGALLAPAQRAARAHLMPAPLRLLMVEDSEDDVLLVRRALERGGSRSTSRSCKRSRRTVKPSRRTRRAS